jgi:ectoine hydroxylase-related dioxygenase (phytanoyl-CoA dioxygenase family)
MNYFLSSYTSLSKVFSYDGSPLKDLESSLKIICGLCLLHKYNKMDCLKDLRRNNYFINAINIDLIPSDENIFDNLKQTDLDQLRELILHTEKSGLIAESAKLEVTYKEKLEGLLIHSSSRDKFEDLISMLSKLVSLVITWALKSDLIDEISYENKSIEADAVSLFNKYGYYVLKSAFPIELVTTAKAVLDKIMWTEIGEGSAYLYGEGEKFQRVYNLLNKNKIFEEFLINKKILQFLDGAFRRDTLHDCFYLSSLQSNTVKSGATDQIWHIDANIPNPIPDWTLRVQCAIALDSFTLTNGSTEILPFSHKKLRNPIPGEDDPNQIDVFQVECPPGSVIFWHGNTWHRSTNNRSSKDRSALLACYSASFLRELSMEENHLRVISTSSMINFSDRTRRLLGYYHGLKAGAIRSE